MERDPAAVPLRQLPPERLEMLGRKSPRRKPEGGPTELTAKHKLLISYAVDGCGHQSLCDRIWIERPVQTEEGTAMLRRRPRPNEPLSLLEAAEILRIRKRNARELMTIPIFRNALEAELQRFRDGEKVMNLHTLVAMRDEPGQGKAADRKVRLQAAALLNGDIGGSATTVNVSVSGQPLVAGIVIERFHERDHDEPSQMKTIEHEDRG